MHFGPTVQVSIGVHDYLQRHLQSQGTPVPAPIVGDAIIDTGATTTTIDTCVAKSLNLTQSGTVQSVGIGGASTGFRAACSVNIKGLKVSIPRAHCHELPPSANVVALIGRDVLRYMLLKYDGIEGVVTLTIPDPRPVSKPRTRAGLRRKRHRRRR
ncbi:MAG: aspartyl protease family protein [Planctomycetota bacterium]